MTDAEQLAAWIEEASLECCQLGCGQPYPDVAAVVAGHVVVATLNAGKEYSGPDLEVWPPFDVARWVRDVRAYLGENPGCGLFEAVNETRPS